MPQLVGYSSIVEGNSNSVHTYAGEGELKAWGKKRMDVDGCEMSGRNIGVLRVQRLAQFTLATGERETKPVVGPEDGKLCA